MNITIENEKYTVVINSFGAEIQSFKRKSDNTEFIWSGDSSVWKNHAPILFPFVARCLGGYFDIEGQKCEYTRNHGFARDLDTDVILQEKNRVIFQLTESEKTLYRYPYKFALITEYTLTENGLNWKITVKNTDIKPFKFSVGTHTAFACPRNTDPKSTHFSDYVIEFEKHEPLTSVVCTPDCYIAVDEKGYTPYTKPYNEKEPGIIPLTKDGFGNGHLFTNFTSEWVGLRNKKDNSLIKINTKGFPYCMIWQNTAGEPQFVCIEPWYGLPDTENTNHKWDSKLELIELKPGDSFNSIQDISF